MMLTIDFKVNRIHKLTDNGMTKAFVDLSVNDAILIKGIRVVEGKRGLFVSMPREQGKNNQWYDSVMCLNDQIRSQISDKVLSAYNEAV